MKFRTICRLLYLKRARHRRGHGIHSPFLFRLITTVVEDKHRYPEYGIYKELKNKALNLLHNYPDSSLARIFQHYSLSHSRKLYQKIELPNRYAKVVFRLIREFKPSSILSYGPTLGVSLALMAMANRNNPIYQVVADPEDEVFSKELLRNSGFSNILFLPEDVGLTVIPDFVMINYPDCPEQLKLVIKNTLEKHSDDGVLVISGIHESKEMQKIWQEVIASECVHVSLDFFEIGIVLFRKGLQKENFIHRF